MISEKSAVTTGDRQMTIRLNVWDQLYQRNNVSSQDQTSNPKIAKSDALPVELTGRTGKSSLHNTLIAYSESRRWGKVLKYCVNMSASNFISWIFQSVFAKFKQYSIICNELSALYAEIVFKWRPKYLLSYEAMH